MSRRVVLTVLVAFAFALLGAGVAQAHVDLMGITVAPAASGTGSTLVLQLSDTVDAPFTSVRVVDAAGRVLVPGPGALDPKDASLLRLDLGSLAPGDYLADWRARASDGHVGNGKDAFTVPTSGSWSWTAPATTAAGGMAGGQASSGGALWEAPFRWLTYLAAALMFGAVAFTFLVWEPAVGSVRGDGAEGSDGRAAAPELTATLDRRLRWVVLAGGFIALVGNLGLLVVQARDAAGVGLASAIGRPVWDVLATHSGRIWIVRMVLIVALLVIGWSLPSADGLWNRPSGIALLVGGAAVLLTFSLTSHAATGKYPVVSVLADWVHLAAMVVWLGGLAALVVGLWVLREREGARLRVGRVVDRFSPTAVACVIALAVTGVYRIVIQSAGVSAYLSSSYGRVLVVKLALFGVLLVFGALNRYVFLPSIKAPTPVRVGSGESGTRTAGGMVGATGSRGSVVGPFAWSVPSETVVATVLLLVVGVLTSLMPV
jgi:copper transport protein